MQSCVILCLYGYGANLLATFVKLVLSFSILNHFSRPVLLKHIVQVVPSFCYDF